MTEEIIMMCVFGTLFTIMTYCSIMLIITGRKIAKSEERIQELNQARMEHND